MNPSGKEQRVGAIPPQATGLASVQRKKLFVSGARVGWRTRSHANRVLKTSDRREKPRRSTANGRFSRDLR